MSQAELTPEQIRNSILAKSDQLNADDLIAGPITVTVQSVRSGDKEQPVKIIIDGGRQPYKPCKGMRRILVQAWTDQGANWVGKRMTLYRNPDVQWGGVKVGGIQISHLSDLPEPVMTYTLTVSRSYKIPYVVKRLDEPGAAAQETADDISRALEIGDRGELFGILNGIHPNDKAEIWSLLTDEEKEAIRAAKTGA